MAGRVPRWHKIPDGKREGACVGVCATRSQSQELHPGELSHSDHPQKAPPINTITELSFHIVEPEQEIWWSDAKATNTEITDPFQR